MSGYPGPCQGVPAFVFVLPNILGGPCPCRRLDVVPELLVGVVDAW